MDNIYKYSYTSSDPALLEVPVRLPRATSSTNTPNTPNFSFLPSNSPNSKSRTRRESEGARPPSLY